MNKNKKVTLLTVIALTTLFATGCGMKPENIKEEVDAFVESHNKIGAAMLMDAGVLGAQKSLKENNVDINIDKYFVYDKVLSEEMDNIKKLKSKELKKLSNEASEFYEKNKELLEKVKKDDISLEQYGSEVEKIESEVIENLEKSKFLKSYGKLREKAGLEELTEYDQTEGWIAEFKDEYEDDLKNLMDDVMEGALKAAVIDKIDVDAADLLREPENSESTKSEVSDSNIVGTFLKKLVRNSADKDNMNIEEEYGSITYEGKNGGHIYVFTASNGSKLDCVSIDAMFDIRDISGEIKTIINKFCNEVNLDEKTVLATVNKLYSEVSSDKYLNSEDAKHDIKEFDLVEKEIELGNGAYVEVTIHDPLESKTEMVNVTIGIRE